MPSRGALGAGGAKETLRMQQRNKGLKQLRRRAERLFSRSSILITRTTWDWSSHMDAPHPATLPLHIVARVVNLTAS